MPVPIFYHHYPLTLFISSLFCIPTQLARPLKLDNNDYARVACGRKLRKRKSLSMWLFVWSCNLSKVRDISPHPEKAPLFPFSFVFTLYTNLFFGNLLRIISNLPLIYVALPFYLLVVARAWHTLLHVFVPQQYLLYFGQLLGVKAIDARNNLLCARTIIFIVASINTIYMHVFRYICIYKGAGNKSKLSSLRYHCSFRQVAKEVARAAE